MTLETEIHTNPDFAPVNSEEFLALQFSARHIATLRYTAAWDKWHIYNGQRWVPDTTLEVFDLARKIVREFAKNTNKSGEAKTVASARTRTAVVNLAREDRGIAASVDQWDADPWLLNTPAGTIDLRTGIMREHRPDDFVTKITSVAPDAACPTPMWETFLSRITNKNDELQSFLQRMAGYALTGSTQEHALFFCYGGGGNGKGVFMNTLIAILADYHRAAPMTTFTASKSERHPTELASLRGARMVTAVETEEGQRWAESTVKALTGGDIISARFMRQDFFEFRPQFKLVIAGNHKPSLRSVDEAIRRRFHLVPFLVTIPADERDPNLSEKLKSELPGIFAWVIEGCLQWRGKGLDPPAIVTDSTRDYLSAENTIGRFIDECCFTEKDLWTAVSELFEVWKQWTRAGNEFTGTIKQFSQKLIDAGYIAVRRDKRGFGGLGLGNGAQR